MAQFELVKKKKNAELDYIALSSVRLSNTLCEAIHNMAAHQLQDTNNYSGYLSPLELLQSRETPSHISTYQNIATLLTLSSR